MPPKSKRRNINNKAQGSNNEDGQNTWTSAGNDNRQQTQWDEDNNVTDITAEDKSGPSTTEESDSTLSSTLLLVDEEEPEDLEEPEVVISASLNFGQNSQVQLKTTTTPIVADQESVKGGEEVPKRSSFKMESESFKGKDGEGSKSNHDSIINEVSQPQRDSGIENDNSLGSSDNNSSVSHSHSTTATNNSGAAVDNNGEEFQLPSTVTTLILENTNTKVFLIGTAHFSTQSQEDVRLVVRKTEPDCILLELCPSRKNILHLDEEMLLREAGDISMAKIAATLRNAPPGSSRVQSLLHLLLLSMSASLTKKLGMAPGGEFRAAVQEAEKFKKQTTLLLGDRPFNITLARAIASLSLMQKIKLAWQFLISSDDITKEEIEQCKERDLLEKMLSEMTGEFPSITEVFVNERDYFLAHTLFLSAKAISATKPNEDAVVVAVVGMGHVPGICKNFGKTNVQEFDRVGNLPPPAPHSTVKWMLKTTVKVTFYGLTLYGAYKLFNRVDIFKKFENGFKMGFVKIK